MFLRKILKVIVTGCAIALSFSGLARAGCTDTAAPGVNWQDCFQDGNTFKKVDIHGANLQGAHFTWTDFSGSTMAKIDARRAKFFAAKLVNADLSGANLAKADLTKADLSGASLKNANLQEALLYRAVLRGADLTGAKLQDANFLKADLSGATWIDGKKVCAEGSIGHCI